MRFKIKKHLHIIIFLLFVHLLFAQTNFSPQILLNVEKQNNTKHLFYAFENATITLNEITETNQWQQIWQYSFLTNKNIELISACLGDISGNGEKELVVVTYSFGLHSEIYIFFTDNNIPRGTPTIYELPNLQKGTKPTQAKLAAWDQDKDQEIILSVSSPERKILVLDYSINELKTVENIAQEFMLNTYGPTQIIIQDINKDNRDDVVVLNNSNQPAIHTIISNQSSFDTPININEKLLSFQLVPQNKNYQEIGINQSGQIFFVLENKPIKNINKFDKIIGANEQNIFFLTQDNKIVQTTINANQDLNILQSQPSPLQYNNITQHISNLQNTHILLSSKKEKKAAIINMQNPFIVRSLDFIKNQPIVQTEPKTLLQEEGPAIENQRIVTHDTLYVNANDTLEIPINTEFNIHSVETIDRPEGILLEPKQLKFIWKTSPSQIGKHILKYNITYNIDTKLETSLTTNEQLALNSIVEQTQEQHQHIIWVNDKPKIYFETHSDTIRPPKTIMVDYTIVDEIFKQKPTLKLLGFKQPAVQIIDNQVYWELTKNNAGDNKLYFSTHDGMSADTSSIEIYVDTTSQTIVYDNKLIATEGKEFIYKLPTTQPNQTYNIIQGPSNLRISKDGQIHWIPIMTQLDHNEIIIETLTDKSRETHTLHIYVNFNPLISYRPAINEHIVQGEQFLHRLESFDANINPQLEWTSEIILKNDTLKNIVNNGNLEITTRELLDNQPYTVYLKDPYAQDEFNGNLYINDIPKIISQPSDYLLLGDTLRYNVVAIDENLEKPFFPTEPNQLKYLLIEFPSGAKINKTGEIFWIPSAQQTGQNNFNVQVSDSLSTTQQIFSIFVNDIPNIISQDSLSIQIGDTLLHSFGVKDLNNNDDLIYNIKTTITELLFNGKEGKITWVPTIDEIGLHTLEISVSDGFNLSEDTQKLKIFVYDLPQLLNPPPQEAFINIPYIYSPKGQDMFLDSLYNVDIFTNIVALDSSWTGKHNKQTNHLNWIPKTTENKQQTLTVSITDKYGHTAQNKFNVTLLQSPCEQQDSLHCTETDTIYIEKPGEKEKKYWRPKTFSPFTNE